MGYWILRTADEVIGYVQSVQHIADAGRAEFGFLPASAYKELASRNRLWVAVDARKELSGYLLFGGRFPNIRIFQIHVVSAARHRGVPATLLDSLLDYAKRHQIQTISAHVAADLPANQFWEKEGYRVIRQVPGGRTTHRTINLRLLELSDSTLFRDSGKPGDPDAHIASISHPILISPSYVLDLNVFFDILRSRPDSESAIQLLSAAMQNEIRVSVTAEFTRELERHSHDTSADPILALAKGLPTLPAVDPLLLSGIVEQIGKVLFPGFKKTGKRADNDKSDLIHLASCIHHRASGFITRDDAILRNSEFFRKEFALEIVSPSELLEPLVPRTSLTHNLLAASGEQQVRVEDMSEHRRGDAERFLSTLEIPSHTLSEILEPGTSQLPHHRLIVTVDGNIVAVCSWRKKGRPRGEIRSYLVAQEDLPVSQRVIDHILEYFNRLVGRNGVTTIRLLTAPFQTQTRFTATNRGFRSAGEQPQGRLMSEMTKFAFGGPITVIEWDRFRADFKQLTGYSLPVHLPPFSEMQNTGVVMRASGTNAVSVMSLFEFETAISPGLVFGSGREGAIVPIKEAYASELLPQAARRLSFLPSKEALLHVEKAYFSKATGKKPYSAGMPVVFYVSGGENGRKEAIGMGRITFTDSLTVTQARVTLFRQGVLSEDQLSAIAGTKGKVNAFTFDSFVTFPKPVPFKQLKALGCVSGANLVTSEKLVHRSILKLISYAFDGGK